MHKMGKRGKSARRVEATDANALPAPNLPGENQKHNMAKEIANMLKPVRALKVPRESV